MLFFFRSFVKSMYKNSLGGFEQDDFVLVFVQFLILLLSLTGYLK
jgi:hypothetical protein